VTGCIVSEGNRESGHMATPIDTAALKAVKIGEYTYAIAITPHGKTSTISIATSKLGNAIAFNCASWP
jgi:hypothetical protein